MGERCVIVCRECSAPKHLLLIPFRSYRERSLWADGHRARTGHDTWFLMDGFPSMSEAQQEMDIADTVEKWIGERPS